MLYALGRRMLRLAGKYHRQLARFFWTALVLCFVTGMVLQPKTVYEGAVTGLNAWWNIVFPSLLPFFIASELLLNFGVVHFMGVLLEPVMRPLFNVPGAGSFVVAVGYTSGYPIGAMVTARLRTSRLCTRIEGERLMAFTNNSSPLFMLVAVAVGMFHDPALGALIAGAHYLANLTLGFALRFYGRRDREVLPAPPQTGNIFSRALREMLRLQREDNRAPGQVIGDAVKKAVNNLLNIGGFIILFAVIIRLLTGAGVIDLLARLLGLILGPLGLAPAVWPAVASGIFEMTIGTKIASEAAAPLLHQLVAVGVILAWSGLSVIAQAASMIAGTDLRLTPFIIVRVFHAALAAVYTCLLFGPARPLAETLARPVFAPLVEHTASLWTGAWLPLIVFLLALGGIVLLALFYHLCRGVRILIFRTGR
ncbi:sporulation integral membrane protein YlbJ [Desulfotomaculum copahuensis]|uniref:Sporulation integral membrane protein YlbJ n=1 Tax=Desulfotomaculum copahuensis TaxID=1838280 RepID=A0A1B7LEY4_9FIRM|nr:sporulation integral membrane protein YlbJ [Desulfotomaculum copahuensis]